MSENVPLDSILASLFADRLLPDLLKTERLQNLYLTHAHSSLFEAAQTVIGCFHQKNMALYATKFIENSDISASLHGNDDAYASRLAFLLAPVPNRLEAMVEQTKWQDINDHPIYAAVTEESLRHFRRFTELAIAALRHLPPPKDAILPEQDLTALAHTVNRQLRQEMNARQSESFTRRVHSAPKRPARYWEKPDSSPQR